MKDKDFFPLSRGDAAFILGLLAFAVVAFLPAVREVEWAGMSLLGWMMAALMVLSPTIALLRLARESTADKRASDGEE